MPDDSMTGHSSVRVRSCAWARLSLLVTAICLGMTVFLAGCRSSSGPGSANTPAEMFQNVVANPIPAGVSNLQGVGDTWQGYSLYIRFTATDAESNAIIDQGFKPVPWKDVSYRFALPSGYDRFTPPWRPESISTQECYERDSVTNGWTGMGTHYLLVDRATGTVHFYGVGS